MILPQSEDEAKFAAAMVTRLPPTVRIGLHEFRITKLSAQKAASDRRYGSCSTTEQEITLQEWFPTRYKAVETFLHELSHAIYWVQGVDDGDKEERTVNLFATGWAAFHRDNPWFLDWLRAAEL